MVASKSKETNSSSSSSSSSSENSDVVVVSVFFVAVMAASQHPHPLSKFTHSLLIIDVNISHLSPNKKLTSVGTRGRQYEYW
jgi:hypothetical protein